MGTAPNKMREAGAMAGAGPSRLSIPPSIGAAQRAPLRVPGREAARLFFSPPGLHTLFTYKDKPV